MNDIKDFLLLIFPTELVNLLDQYCGLPDGIIFQWLDFDGAWGGFGLIYATQSTSILREDIPQHWKGDRTYVNIWTIRNNLLECKQKFTFKEKDFLTMDTTMSILETSWQSIDKNQYCPNGDVKMQFFGDVLKEIWLEGNATQLSNLHLPSTGAYNRWWDSDTLVGRERQKKSLKRRFDQVQ